jgi:EAL domain-containing protein (putative c-di-GMP-specific phosphodiesterase class I)
MLQALTDVLTPIEQADVRALFQPAGTILGVHEYLGVTSLPQLVAQAQSGWLVSMLRDERLHMVFQPIVSCAEPEQVFAYECLLRGTNDGQIVYPNQLLSVARGADLLFQLDLAARRTAIRDAVRYGIGTKLFINFTPSAIYDPTFCLRSTVQALDEAQIAPDRVVFEIIESDHVAADYLRRICHYYREHGFSIALDDIGSGYSSLTLLNKLRPDYMKLDMQLIRNIDHDAYKALITGKLLKTAQGLGITTIAEGVETAAEYAWLRHHGADLVQGYYIAKPAAPPPVPAPPPAVFA